jgi:hypothetical protein
VRGKDISGGCNHQLKRFSPAFPLALPCIFLCISPIFLSRHYYETEYSSDIKGVKKWPICSKLRGLHPLRRDKQIDNKDKVITYLYGIIWWVKPNIEFALVF